VADGSNSIGHFGLWVRAGATVAQGQAGLAQLRGLLPTDCAPAYGAVIYGVEELDPADGAGDATRCAVFVFETATVGQMAVISVPGLRSDLVDPADPLLVNQADPAVAAFIAELQSGLWCNRFGYVLGTCVAALVQIREPYEILLSRKLW
jgi:hypothetical protein